MIATPVDKAACSGLLKAWLDLLPQFALADKVVLPRATGGSLAHSLALDYALRPVLQSMGARHVVQGFLVVDRYIESDRDGVTTISGDALPGLGTWSTDLSGPWETALRRGVSRVPLPSPRK